jgi:hypothetical protein
MSNDQVAEAMKRTASVAHTGLAQLMARGLAKRLTPIGRRNRKCRRGGLIAIEPEGEKALKRIEEWLSRTVGGPRIITDGYETIFTGVALLNAVRKGGIQPEPVNRVEDRKARRSAKAKAHHPPVCPPSTAETSLSRNGPQRSPKSGQQE